MPEHRESVSVSSLRRHNPSSDINTYIALTNVNFFPQSTIFCHKDNNCVVDGAT